MNADLAEIVAVRLQKLRRVDAACLRAIHKDVSRQVVPEPARAVIRLATDIVERDPPGGYAMAYLLISYHPTAQTHVRARDLQQFGRRMRSWGEADVVAGLAGPAWREGQISAALIHRWARSRNRWWRRVALVSTLPLNVKSHGGTGDAPRTLAVCRLLVSDRDDMVVKAMSWALRALAEREPRAVADFVTAQEDRLARRVVREVRNKLRTGRKSV
ncbi:MAG: DNA alkylation repair protein [Gemmatimonadota bacterium]|nr:MAG: DNA alkylation repair protein [Gemmatimonadota bacterium]